MTRLVVLPAVFAGIAWLLRRDAKERETVSAASWIVLVWAVIYASRPVTSWFAGAEPGLTPASSDDGTPAEALIHLCLIVAGLAVLMRRDIRLSALVRDNRWLLVFYGFWLLSIAWSDYPYITFKRLFRDFGNLVMVLVILTGRDAGSAMRAIVVRCAYVCIPLSMVLIRYVPEWGRASFGFDQSEVMAIGMTPHKNTLGMLALVGALFLLWDLLELRRAGRGESALSSVLSRWAVLSMCWYLLITLDSATSLLCAIAGSALLLLVWRTSGRGRSLVRVEAFGLCAAIVLWGLDSAFAVRESLIQSLGRDLTLTTRTELWPLLNSYQEHPWLGAGFNTFWAGSRLVRLQEAVGAIIQAHNGYLETYLNGGWLGVGLLAAVLLSAYWRIRQDVVLGVSESRMRLVILFVAVVYNAAEASFNQSGFLWLVTVFALMAYRGDDESAAMEATG